jgi:outer membrane protein OmpA-like peptidoglycan-associated protein
LNDLAKLLDERAGWKLIVTGHTDNVGSEKSNMTLSKARAASIKDFMTKAGIDASRIDTKWYGPNRPIADNTTTEGRQKNRRVELTIIQN